MTPDNLDDDTLRKLPQPSSGNNRIRKIVRYCEVALPCLLYGVLHILDRVCNENNKFRRIRDK
jgi:hypothetical protein